jgi:tetratricopeptide (TPR) repeat protein
MQKNRKQKGLVVVLGMLCLAGSAFAQLRHEATVVLTSGQQAQGMVRYLPASRNFEIQVGQATREIRADEVAQVILRNPPPELPAALADVQGGRYQQAIPVLSKIVEDYAMFGPDVLAGGALMRAYMQTGRSSDALRAGETMQRRNPRLERQASFASVYWEVLLQEERFAGLRSSIQEAIQSGSRDLAAVGLLRRGDLEMREGRAREALVDGYLRVVLLFRDVAAVQPEALFKAMKAHEGLNEVALAEKWRQRLLGSFGTSEYAQQLR